MQDPEIGDGGDAQNLPILNNQEHLQSFRSGRQSKHFPSLLKLRFLHGPTPARRFTNHPESGTGKNVTGFPISDHQDLHLTTRLSPIPIHTLQFVPQPHGLLRCLIERGEAEFQATRSGQRQFPTSNEVCDPRAINDAALISHAPNLNEGLIGLGVPIRDNAQQREPSGHNPPTARRWFW